MYDVVIIGSGLAACTTALSIESTKKVLMLTKGEITACNSYHAQGGIAVTMSSDIDKINGHIADTYKTGANTGNLQTISELVCKSQLAIDFLETQGVKFDRNDKEEYHFTREGGHNDFRILHAGGDYSGKVIMENLIEQVQKQSNITIYEHAQALYFKDKQLVYSQQKELYTITSDAFVIASGGIGSAFLTTTSVDENRGDFITLAQSANLELENLHFQQFHPTVYYPKAGQEIFLLSEALRGEGAILRNSLGEEFMPKYHEMGNLAPRDVVSRAILSETKRLDDECVYLDFRSKNSEFLTNRFPLVVKYCLEVGLDLANDLIPVFPAAHYTVGGIKTDLAGKTANKHIYACGECASTGVHGANRLASNSLLECVVMGMNVANAINNQDTISYSTKLLDQVTSDYHYDEKELKQKFNNNLAVERNEQAINDLEVELQTDLKKLLEQQALDLNWYNHYNQLQLGLTIIKQIKAQPQSIGCHYMEGK